MWKPYNVESKINITSFFSAFVRSCPEEFFFQGESHDFWEIAYVMKGSVCMSVDDKVIELGENSIIFHKPMEFHSIRTACDRKTELFITSFSIQGDYINRFKNSIFSLNHSQKRCVSEIIDVLSSHAKTGREINEPTGCLDILAEYPLEFEVLRNLAENFLISFSGAGEIHTSLIKNPETNIYADALRIIDENIFTRLTVSDLSKKCNVSVSYIKKIFGKYNGLGIHEYILRCKISLAKQLLLEGESVTEISEKLAFSSQNYFSTAFKREVGISPGQYRNKIF